MLNCPYCGNACRLVGGLEIYPHRPDLDHKKFWLCAPCDAFVGCHPNTTKALGTPAKPRLRALRKNAHAVFDPIWKNGLMTRKGAYAWLTRATHSGTQVHIGEADEKLCELIIQLSVEKMNDLCRD